MGEAPTADEGVMFEALAGRPQKPGAAVDDTFWSALRGGSAAILTPFLSAALCDHSDGLAPGERAVLPDWSANVWQAGKSFQHLDGIFSSVPALASLVTNKTADTLVSGDLSRVGERAVVGATARRGLSP